MNRRSGLLKSVVAVAAAFAMGSEPTSPTAQFWARAAHADSTTSRSRGSRFVMMPFNRAQGETSSART